MAVIAVPGVAYAAGAFTSPTAVAHGLPNGAGLFRGTHPKCTAVRAGVEYRCVLSPAPTPDTLPRLTEQQAVKVSLAPPNFGPIKIVHRIRDHHRSNHAVFTPRQNRLNKRYTLHTLEGYGWTAAQALQYYNGPTANGIRPGHFMGVNYPTVNATHHIDGACRSITSDGTVWDCWLGEAALRHKVITTLKGSHLGGLGGYMPTPIGGR